MTETRDWYWIVTHFAGMECAMEVDVDPDRIMSAPDWIACRRITLLIQDPGGLNMIPAYTSRPGVFDGERMIRFESMASIAQPSAKFREGLEKAWSPSPIVTARGNGRLATP